MWDELTELSPTAPLPEQLPHLFYERLGSLLRCGLYAARIEPFLQHFPRENMMFISFAGVQTQTCRSFAHEQLKHLLHQAATRRCTYLCAEFVRSPQQVLDEVYTFVGVSRAKFCPLPAGMQVRPDCADVQHSLPGPAASRCDHFTQ